MRDGYRAPKQPRDALHRWIRHMILYRLLQKRRVGRVPVAENTEIMGMFAECVLKFPGIDSHRDVIRGALPAVWSAAWANAR